MFYDRGSTKDVLRPSFYERCSTNEVLRMMFYDRGSTTEVLRTTFYEQGSTNNVSTNKVLLPQTTDRDEHTRFSKLSQNTPTHAGRRQAEAYWCARCFPTATYGVCVRVFLGCIRRFWTGIVLHSSGRRVGYDSPVF